MTDKSTSFKYGSLLADFSVAYLDGVMKGAHREIQGHWQTIREAFEKGTRELADCKARLVRSIAGDCLKCGIGPQRETCAYPEACEHPGRVAALERNQALLRLASHAEREGMNNGAAQQNSLPAKGDEYIPLEKGASSNSADAASPNWPAATREQRSGSAADGDDSAQSGSQAVPSTGDMKAGSIPAGPAAPSAASGPDALAELARKLDGCDFEHSAWDEDSNNARIVREVATALRSRPAQGDAERWRWLRLHLYIDSEGCLCLVRNSVYVGPRDGIHKEGAKMDAAIDAAMSQQEGK